MIKAKPLSARKMAILMAALECFNEKGIEATTINEIGEKAKASVGSMYHHFGNKEGIAIALLVEGLRKNAEQSEKRLKSARTAKQCIHASVTSLLDWVCDNQDWARFIYTISSTRLMQTADKPLRELNSDYLRIVETYYGPHIAAGAFRKIPSECLAPLILGPSHDYARRWLNQQTKGDIKKHAKVFSDAAWLVVKKN